MKLIPYIFINRNLLSVTGTKKEVFSKCLKIAREYGEVRGSDEMFGDIYLKTKLNLRQLHFPRKIKISVAATEVQDLTIIRFGDRYDYTSSWLRDVFGKEFFKKWKHKR